MPIEPALIQAAFDMQPEDAVQFLKSKGVVIPADYKQMLAQARARAFSVAGVTQLNLLQDVLDLLAEATQQGRTFEDFKKELPKRLSESGWINTSGEPLSTPWRLATIFRTNVQTALMASRYKTLQRVKKSRELWQYVAIQDSRTRPSHAALHGRIYPADHPFWQSHFPPNGFRCRCDVITYSRAEAEDLGLSESEGGEPVNMQIPASARNAETRKVQAWRDSDGTLHVPDAGFDGLPTGEHAPDFSRYDDALVKSYKKAQKSGRFVGRFSNLIARFLP